MDGVREAENDVAMVVEDWTVTYGPRNVDDRPRCSATSPIAIIQESVVYMKSSYTKIQI